MTYLRWALLFMSIIVYRVWFPESPPFHGVRFDYDLVVIIMIGLYRGASVGAAAGWAIGFVTFATDADHFAWGSLLGAVLGWVMGHWRDRLFLEQLLSRWIVFAVIIFAYRLIHWPLIMGIGGGPFFETLLFKVMPTVLIDATVAVVLCRGWERIDRHDMPRGQVSMAERSNL